MASDPTVPRKATWRLDARMRERLQWAVVGVILILLFIGLRPFYFHIVHTRDFQSCQSNMLQIARGISLYSDDSDGALPLADGWMTVVQGYLAARSGSGFKVEHIFHCPRDKSGTVSSYAYNSVLSGYAATHRNMSDAAVAVLEKAGRPDRVPLVIEKHGSAMNEQVQVVSWKDLERFLTTPHDVPKPTGSIVTGGQKPSSVSTEKIAIRSGQTF